MSEDTPNVPRNPPPADVRGRPEQPRGGSMLAGLLLGALALYVFYMGAFFIAGPAPTPTGLVGPVAFVPLVVYLLVAILLAVRRPTSLFGAGLLIGFGFWTLFGGGLCMASLAQAGG